MNVSITVQGDTVETTLSLDSGSMITQHYVDLVVDGHSYVVELDKLYAAVYAQVMYRERVMNPSLGV